MATKKIKKEENLMKKRKHQLLPTQRYIIYQNTHTKK